MSYHFIFMLTRNDRTVADAKQHLITALAQGVQHIGFKDIGLPIEDLKELHQLIKQGGATSYIEVVSLDLESEIASAKAAVDIGVDYLLGGTQVEHVLPLLSSTAIKYYPFAGVIEGHPSILSGSIQEVVVSAKHLASYPGVHGLDLLAYRSREDVPKLIAAVTSAVDKPVIVAGSIDSFNRIKTAFETGADGFTIGTAALDGVFAAKSKQLSCQLDAIQDALVQVVESDMMSDPQLHIA
jgi:DNA-binding NarL/FixJ family response regulator